LKNITICSEALNVIGKVEKKAIEKVAIAMHCHLRPHFPPSFSALMTRHILHQPTKFQQNPAVHRWVI